MEESCPDRSVAWAMTEGGTQTPEPSVFRRIHSKPRKQEAKQLTPDGRKMAPVNIGQSPAQIRRRKK